MDAEKITWDHPHPIENHRHSSFITKEHFRTSTPRQETFEKHRSDNYESFKKHLSDVDTNFKIRGAQLPYQDDFISGHIAMKEEKRTDLPEINDKFINLLLNSPNSKKMICTKRYCNGPGRELKGPQGPCSSRCSCNECSWKYLNFLR